MYQNGRHSLQSFSEVQGVELSYNEDGQLVDRGTPEEADAIMAMLEDEWGSVPDGHGGPPRHQRHHRGHPDRGPARRPGRQRPHRAAGRLETVPVPDPVPAEGMTVEYPHGGNYWNDFDRTNPADAAARGEIRTGTVHGLVGELGVGTVTASALTLALGMTALIAGLGVINILTGAGLFWAAGARRDAVDRPVDQEDDGRVLVDQNA